MSASETKFSTRRSNVQVIADILSETINGASKTRLVYKTNLNFKVMERYLALLGERGMIQFVSENGKKSIYRITERGKEFLLHYSQVEDMLKLLS